MLRASLMKLRADRNRREREWVAAQRAEHEGGMELILERDPSAINRYERGPWGWRTYYVSDGLGGVDRAYWRHLSTYHIGSKPRMYWGTWLTIAGTALILSLAVALAQTKPLPNAAEALQGVTYIMAEPDDKGPTFS